MKTHNDNAGLLFSLLACISIALASAPQPASALQVADLYSHRIAVANESNTERLRAFSEALAKVIVKVTGEQRWLLDPNIISAVANASSYVEAVSYSSETLLIEAPPEVDDNTGADVADATSITGDLVAAVAESEASTAAQETELISIEQRFMEIDFSAALIDELLLDSNIPLWDSNRPSVLVWMILQNEVGDRNFLSDESNPELTSLIRAFAKERGLPIIFPVLDFEDRRNLPVDVIWTLDSEAIRSASERYGADSILSGRLHFTAGGELVGLWQFDFQGQAESFDGFDRELKSYLDAPLDRVTTQLANYFAILPQLSNEQSLSLRIEGVKTLDDYSSLMNYLGNLGLVEKVTTRTLEREQLNLDVIVLGDSTQLFELIALDRDLLPIENSSVSSDQLLHYRWTR